MSRRLRQHSHSCPLMWQSSSKERWGSSADARALVASLYGRLRSVPYTLHGMPYHELRREGNPFKK